MRTEKKDNQLLADMHAFASPEVFQNALKLRHKMTPTEKKLWSFLCLNPDGYKFRRQHPFNAYVMDFYCHRARVSIEVDGVYHEERAQKKLDEERTKVINSFGVTELRFLDNEVESEFEEVKVKILAFLRKSKKEYQK